MPALHKAFVPWACAASAAFALTGCLHDDPFVPDPEPQVDAGPEIGEPFTIAGVARSAVTGEPLRQPMHLVVHKTWETSEDPFAEDSAPLDELDVQPDGSFQTRELGWAAGLIGMFLDDAEGAPDDFVLTVNDRRLRYYQEVYPIDALGLPRSLLDGWRTDPRLAARDIESEGFMLLFFAQDDGTPIAGVEPILSVAVGKAGSSAYFFLSNDLTELLPADVARTGASGAMLVVGAQWGYASGRHRLVDFEVLGVASPPSGCFVETIQPL